MEDLINRLEKAEAGSRELSDGVLLACGWTSDSQGHGLFWCRPDGTTDFLAPCPTTDMNAAMELVAPSTYHLEVIGDQGDDGWVWHVLIDRREYVAAATPALALCIAILKAKGE